MLEDKVREIFADMVVLKDPQRNEYFSNLSIPSYMRDWLVMKFSDDNGTIDYESVGRYIKRYIPSREDFEQYKFQMVNGDTVQFLARVRVSVDVKTGKTVFELPDFGGSRGGAGGVVAYDVAEKWQNTLLRESENWGIVTLCWMMDGTPSKPKGLITMIGYKPFCPYDIDLEFYRDARSQFSIHEWIDVIIEAIFENLEAKQTLFADLERRAKPGALLASNTSSLRLADIAQVLQQPERLVGIHFFNPVAQMPLVEVVASENTSTLAAQQAAAFVKQIDKLPLPVKDAPGFLVNAVLAPYLNEAMRCVDEGIAPEVIDAAMLAFGMPMGPIELADTVGLDIALTVGRQLISADQQPKKVAELVTAKRLGKKSGQGFYLWVDGRAKKSRVGAVPDGLSQRLLKPLLAATVARVAAGVVEDADLADAGIIFGTGFAPYTGGPINYQAHHIEKK